MRGSLPVLWAGHTQPPEEGAKRETAHGSQEGVLAGEMTAAEVSVAPQVQMGEQAEGKIKGKE